MLDQATDWDRSDVAGHRKFVREGKADVDQG